eukprot:14589548-Ditylum_brightwellii.AAC.1
MGRYTKKKLLPTWQACKESTLFLAASWHQMVQGNRLHTVFGLPERSCVIANGMGSMDDTTWLKVVTILAPAIRKMK